MLEKILKNYPTLRPIKTPALIDTATYNFIAPLIFQQIYEKIELYDFQIYHVTSPDSHRRQLKGFVVIERNMSYHQFLLGYDAQIYYNHQPLKNTEIDNFINRLLLLSLELEKEKNIMNTTNLDRLKLEIEGIELSDKQAEVYLLENDLKANELYQPQSSRAKKAIYQTAISILNSIANQPDLMKSVKSDSFTVSEFAKYLQNRIDQLEKTIQQMPVSDEKTNYFSLFAY